MNLINQLPAAPSPIDEPMIVNCIAYRNDGTRIGDIGIDAISDVRAFTPKAAGRVRPARSGD